MQLDTQQQEKAERIEELIQEVASFSDQRARSIVQELLQSTLGMYGDCLTRMLTLAGQHEECGSAIVHEFGEDDLIGPLLLLHGLHPVDTRTRVLHALEGLRPSLQAHGGYVQLVRIEQGVAYVKLLGSCNGCAASNTNYLRDVEDAVYKVAPELDDILAVPEEASTSHPVTFIPKRPPKQEKGVRPVVSGED
ncbi:NifU family protein [Dictyobacter kobayashii]|uniref:NIF system FeS cluster assembly NifU C-terminal domain-containing protein n=1 Tax=Dictyobacter kobayashii TaxID=2014872 RepID=A0A402AZ13_9CHLR|nr:NifU family protein [Dictyobacter kobayashii]GCE24295.1 hypothetical protein KDK_80950 [Dictyobacter kobayashii]